MLYWQVLERIHRWRHRMKRGLTQKLNLTISFWIYGLCEFGLWRLSFFKISLLRKIEKAWLLLNFQGSHHYEAISLLADWLVSESLYLLGSSDHLVYFFTKKICFFFHRRLTSTDTVIYIFMIRSKVKVNEVKSYSQARNKESYRVARSLQGQNQTFIMIFYFFINIIIIFKITRSTRHNVNKS